VKEEMARARLLQSTEAEVRRLKMFVDGKVGADNIAKYVR
jgi:hypothetical protein